MCPPRASQQRTSGISRPTDKVPVHVAFDQLPSLTRNSHDGAFSVSEEEIARSLERKATSVAAGVRAVKVFRGESFSVLRVEIRPHTKLGPVHNTAGAMYWRHVLADGTSMDTRFTVGESFAALLKQGDSATTPSGEVYSIENLG
eukprot:Lankesteria_metandrocarpae@DN2910_c0_g1_i1.p1